MDEQEVNVALDTIFQLATALSTAFTGTPAMYEANKVMHAVWKIRDLRGGDPVTR